MEKDFAPISDIISLHGLGFMQVVLPGNQRLHVWHPDLPRRTCFERSAIHNHRFSFVSTVLAGVQANRRWLVAPRPGGSHDRISHDGLRSERGGRLSYVAERVDVRAQEIQRYSPGQSYFMPELEYHDTPNDGIVITVMRKLHEGDIHASSLIEHGYRFDQDFDRFALPADDLWRLVTDAFKRTRAR